MTLLLTEGITEDIEVDSIMEESKSATRQPTLDEVMLDPDFLAELRLRNEELNKYLTKDRVLQMVDYLVIEPGFEDTHHRCF